MGLLVEFNFVVRVVKTDVDIQEFLFGQSENLYLMVCDGEVILEIQKWHRCDVDSPGAMSYAGLGDEKWVSRKRSCVKVEFKWALRGDS